MASRVPDDSSRFAYYHEQINGMVFRALMVLAFTVY